MENRPRRPSVPPPRLTYGGRGLQAESSSYLGLGTSRQVRKVDQPQVPVMEPTAEEPSEQRIRDKIAEHNRIISMGMEMIEKTAAVADLFQNATEDDTDPDEWKKWLEIRRNRNNARHCVSLSRQKLPELYEALTKLEGEAQKKTEKSVTSFSSTVTKKVDLQFQLELHEFSRNSNAIRDEIEDLEGTLKSTEADEDIRRIQNLLESARRRLTRCERDYNAEKVRRQERQKLENEVAMVDADDDQNLDGEEGNYQNESNFHFDNPQVENSEYYSYDWLGNPMFTTGDNDEDQSQDGYFTPPLYRRPQRQRGQTGGISKDVSDLAKALELAFRGVGGRKEWEPKDLPLFNGTAEDWPIFLNEFQRTTPNGMTNSSQNAIRLRKALKGPARDAVLGLLNEPKNVGRIIEMLGKLFGRSQLIINSLIMKAEAAKAPDEKKPDTFVTFATSVFHLVETVKSLKELRYLSDMTLLSKLVSKLPTSYAVEWISWVSSQPHKPENLSTFAEWMEMKMDVLVRLTTPVIKQEFVPGRGKRGSVAVNTTAAEENFEEKETSPKENKICSCCGRNNHKLKNCFKFKKLPMADKLSLVKKNGLCYQCLETGHLVKDCTSSGCQIKDCTRKHNTLLHPVKPANSGSSNAQKTDLKLENPHVPEPEVQSISSTVVSGDKSSKPLSVVKVKVIGPGGTRRVYALLDSGSDTTLIESSVIDELQITGKSYQHQCRGVFGKQTTTTGKCVNLKVTGCYPTAKEYEVHGVVSVNKLNLSPYTQNADDAKKKWPHLRPAKLQNLEEVNIQMIIGEDNPFLSAHRRICENRPDDPMAKRTVLGWVLAGRKLGKEKDIRTNYVATDGKDNLDSLMKSFFSLDTFGIYPESSTGSVEDKRALAILDGTVKKAEKGWECGLLWKSTDVKFPDSKKDALARLQSTEYRLKKDPVCKEMYYKKIEEYKQKGYITELSQSEAETHSERTLYIPHFPVFNVNKPGKLRLVFDAANRTGGASLNEELLTGPDLIKSLSVVLMNFRRHNIAITADIEDMFHRVSVREEDRDSQRFLWRDWNKSSNPPLQVFVMNVLIFGARSSPSSAIFVKDKNAMEYADTYPEASRAIQEEFYCDDFCSGRQTIEEAIRLREEVSKICAEGNFFLKKWLSNIREVMESVPKSDCAAEAKVFGEKTEIPPERVLGIWWNHKEDYFTFTANLKKVKTELLDGRRPTKRELSGVVMSIFDPLGFIANYKIKGVILLQKTWRSGTDWDEDVTDEVYHDWLIWIHQLKETVNVKVPRVYAQDIHLATTVELHTIMDASNEAVCSVCYLRVKVGTVVTVAFMMGKTKVAPTKKLTIPRLELLAATIGACMADTITTEVKIKLTGRFFWCDSKTVLQWIRSEILRFKEYVANRVNRIHLLSNVSEWRWISSGLNTADDGTRLNSPCNLHSDSDWLSGPAFLLEEPDMWPVENRAEKIEEDETEIRKVNVSITSDVGDSLGVSVSVNEACGLREGDKEVLIKMENFSSFSRMVRAQAAVIKAAKYWVGKIRPGMKKETAPWSLVGEFVLPSSNVNQAYMKQVAPFIRKNVISKLAPADIEVGENILIKKVQDDCFKEDIMEIAAGKISKRNKLWRLSPYLDGGIIKMMGRITNANVEASVQSPIILPSRHHFTELLIHREHVRCAHQGQSTVLASLRKKFWILEGRAAVRRVFGRCQKCKLDRAQPILPKMGDLPHYRLSSGRHPFFFTGVDLFGPLEVVVGRHHEKRWIILFTCMVTRAVHLEVVYGLSTDETLNAFSRFIDTRGRPRHVYSDNGTNFVGAKKEIKAMWESIDWDQVAASDKMQEIDWHFMPPYSPHFGGAWERMVQSVKKVLKKTMTEKYPKDQTLLTMLKGAENIVNSRPLTYVSADPDDLDPLTPNHFLRGFADVGPSVPGDYKEENEHYRVHWRRAQHFIERFWEQWSREVLPELAKRTKWHQDAEPIGIGELVFMVDKDASRNTWKRGVITTTFPGKDGQVRVVELLAVNPDGRKTIYKRGVDSICPLGLRMGKSEPLP